MALSDLRPRPSSRRRMNMFYLLDTSGSMRYKDCIGSVNRAMPEIVDILREISESNHDHSDIYMSCITFDNDARQLYDSPVNVKDFRWANVRAEGLTNLKSALTMLEHQMVNEQAAIATGMQLRPAVLLLSDGDPDDGWEEALDRLQGNRLFREAYKIAIAIGCKPANQEMRRALTRFAQPLDAGGEPIIISINELDKLYQVIKLVSSTVSRIGSRNTGANGGSDTWRQINNVIRNEVGEIVGVDIPSIAKDGGGWY